MRVQFGVRVVGRLKFGVNVLDDWQIRYGRHREALQLVDGRIFGLGETGSPLCFSSIPALHRRLPADGRLKRLLDLELLGLCNRLHVQFRHRGAELLAD